METKPLRWQTRVLPQLITLYQPPLFGAWKLPVKAGVSNCSPESPGPFQEGLCPLKVVEVHEVDLQVKCSARCHVPALFPGLDFQSCQKVKKGARWVVAHTFNLSKGGRGRQVSQFPASLIYRESLS